MKKNSITLACAAIVGLAAFSHAAPTDLGDTASFVDNGAATGEGYGFRVTDDSDNANETSAAAGHRSFWVYARKTVNADGYIFGAVIDALAANAASDGQLNGVYGTISRAYISGTYGTTYDYLDAMIGVHGSAALYDMNAVTDKFQKVNRVQSLTGGQFFAFPDNEEGGSHLTGANKILEATGVSGSVYYNAPNGSGAEANLAMGSTVADAFGGKFSVDLLAERNTGGNGNATIDNAYGVRSVVTLADAGVGSSNQGAITNAYAVYAKIDDSGSKITGDKYALYVVGDSLRQGRDISTPQSQSIAAGTFTADTSKAYVELSSSVSTAASFSGSGHVAGERITYINVGSQNITMSDSATANFASTGITLGAGDSVTVVWSATSSKFIQVAFTDN